MVIIHEVYKAKDLTDDQQRLLLSLKKKRLIELIRRDGVIGVARYGTNRGRDSQLDKIVKAAR